MDASPSPPPPPPARGDARARRSVRMRPELWDGLDALARAQGISTNAFLEVIAERVVRVSDGSPTNEPPREERGAYKGVHFRLREADREALREQAASTGYTITGWVTAVIRARVRKAPLLAVAEIEALIEANRQLAAVGRNLNTVVHQLHRTGRWAGNLDLYAKLLEIVKRNRARVEAVIASAHEQADIS